MYWNLGKHVQIYKVCQQSWSWPTSPACDFCIFLYHPKFLSDSPKVPKWSEVIYVVLTPFVLATRLHPMTRGHYLGNAGYPCRCCCVNTFVVGWRATISAAKSWTRLTFSGVLSVANLCWSIPYPIASMYGVILTYIYQTNQLCIYIYIYIRVYINVSKYTRPMDAMGNF